MANRIVQCAQAAPATIAAARRPDLWYNETALKIPGAAATAQVPGAMVARLRRDNDKGGSR